MLSDLPEVLCPLYLLFGAQFINMDTIILMIGHNNLSGGKSGGKNCGILCYPREIIREIETDLT